MELYEMLYQRLMDSVTLSSLLAKYKGRPAIFYQRAATADDKDWGEKQYPRIDYTVDMQENPSRNTSGLLLLHIWCNTGFGAEPEDIEYVVRDLLHSTFAKADDDTYCLAWVRSDAFDVKANEDETIQIVGVSLTFDIMACPCQYTTYPDPIKALNEWTKKLLPSAVVIGHDEFEGWIVPTKEQPVVYWRLTSQGVQRKHLTHTWLNISVEGHVYARNAADRLYNLVRLNTAHALAGHITMEDMSPLFLKSFVCKPHLNYIAQGQIQASGHFGVLQEWYGKKPDPILANANTDFTTKE